MHSMRVHSIIMLLCFIFKSQGWAEPSSLIDASAGEKLLSYSSSDNEEEEIKRLRQSAEGLTTSSPEQVEEKIANAETVFTRQSLNPEISVVIDAGGHLSMKDFDTETLDESQFYFRVLGLHLQSSLDPFSFFKAAIEVHSGKVGLGEAYATWVNLLPGLNLTLGKFRQQFGVVQRWHVPSLDQYYFPLPLTTVLGPEGLNQIGISLQLRMPALWADDQQIVLQVTNGMSEHLFTGQLFGMPVGLLRWSQYFDLTESTYLEFGLTGMLGTNNLRNLTGEDDEEINEPWRTTTLAGADLTISWAPLNQERYQHFTWRSEFYWVGKETPDGYIAAGGGYSYLDVGLTEALAIGMRGDLTQPFAVENNGEWLWQAVGYLTWWQSPWVKTRLQLVHQDSNSQPAEDRLIIQVVFAAGPHKHERY